ncbi:MAG: DUF6502 family protein [Pseudomonadota bacterium]
MDIRAALHLALKPLVRMALGRGLLFQEVSEIVRRCFVEVAEEELTGRGEKRTLSRLSLITGLQRRDLRALQDTPPPKTSPGSRAALALALWPGAPDPLSRPDFEAFATSLGKDVHPRTLLDELVSRDVVSIDGDTIHPLTRTMIPTDDPNQLDWYARNLADHGEAATANLLNSTPQHLDRALYFNRLSRGDVAALKALTTAEGMALLNALRARAADAQDATNPDALHRVRAGIYFYSTEET